MADTSEVYDTANEWQIFFKKEGLPMTVRYLFTLTRPAFLVQESKMPGTKWHNDFVDVSFQDIEEWEDFNERNANSAFPLVINHAVPFNQHLEVPFERLDHRRRIHEEKDVDDYFLDVIGPILGHALGHSADKLCEGTQNPSSRKLRIPFAKDASKIALPQHASPDAWRHEKRPNFPIYLPAKSMPRLMPSRDVIHVIGDSARTRSLDPVRSFADEAGYKGCGRNHVGKLAMYCRGAGTCLAFTMTHVGVTVFRFFVVEGTGTGSTSSSSRLGVQQRTFPWCPKIVSSKEECVMSGIKAIYVLLVMSLFPEGHALQERSKLRSLADWPKINFAWSSSNNFAPVEMPGLPNVPGPKLMPFIPDGTPYDLEFIKLLGSGEHGHVWKVTINGEIYALKMFRFDDRFTPTHWWDVDLPKEDQRTWQYAFNCECRAYARLKEVKKEFVAIPCYGYLMLGEEHQRALREKDKLDWEVDWGRSEKDKEQPLEALVKKFVDWQPVAFDDYEDGFNRRRIRLAIDSAATARKLIRNMKIVHRAGILCNDINSNNVLDGQFLEFSSAFTAPHPCLSTKQIESRDHPFDSVGDWDAFSVDDMINDFNNDNLPSEYIWDRARPNRQYQAKLRSHQRPPGWKEGPWNWDRGYSLRPDKFRWDKIGETKGSDPEKLHEFKSKKEKRKKKKRQNAKDKT